MENKKNIWKVIAVIIGIIFYIILLFYISSAQSDSKVLLETEKNQYIFENAENDPESDYRIKVKINNKSNRMLGSAPEYNVFLSYHLYDVNGNLISDENVHSPLETNIFAHSKGNSTLSVSPLERGEYELVIDMVEEGVMWFSEQDGQACEVKLVIY